MNNEHTMTLTNILREREKEFDALYGKAIGNLALVRDEIKASEKLLITKAFEAGVKQGKKDVMQSIKQLQKDTRDTMLDCDDRRFLFREILALRIFADK